MAMAATNSTGGLLGAAVPGMAQLNARHLPSCTPGSNGSRGRSNKCCRTQAAQKPSVNTTFWWQDRKQKIVETQKILFSKQGRTTVVKSVSTGQQKAAPNQRPQPPQRASAATTPAKTTPGAKASLPGASADEIALLERSDPEGEMERSDSTGETAPAASMPVAAKAMAGGYSAAQIAFMDRKKAESGGASVSNASSPAKPAASAAPVAKPAPSAFSPEQTAFMDRRKAEAGGGAAATPMPSATPSKFAAGGMSAEQMAFMARKKAEAAGAVTPVAASAAPKPAASSKPVAAPMPVAAKPAAGGFSPEQIAFMARRKAEGGGAVAPVAAAAAPKPAASSKPAVSPLASAGAAAASFAARAAAAQVVANTKAETSSKPAVAPMRAAAKPAAGGFSAEQTAFMERKRAEMGGAAAAAPKATPVKTPASVKTSTPVITPASVKTSEPMKAQAKGKGRSGKGLFDWLNPKTEQMQKKAAAETAVASVSSPPSAYKPKVYQKASTPYIVNFFRRLLKGKNPFEFDDDEPLSKEQMKESGMEELLAQWNTLEEELSAMQPEQLVKLGLIVDENNPVDNAALEQEVAEFERRWQKREARLVNMRGAVSALKQRLASLENIRF